MAGLQPLDGSVQAGLDAVHASLAAKLVAKSPILGHQVVVYGSVDVILMHVVSSLMAMVVIHGVVDAFFTSSQSKLTGVDGLLGGVQALLFRLQRLEAKRRLSPGLDAAPLVGCRRFDSELLPGR